MAARLLDEAMHHGEPEPRALAGGFGRKEGLEYPIEDVFRDAGAGVGHAHNHILPGIDVAEVAHIGVVEIGVRRLDGETAALRHGGLGVQGKIEKQVLQLMRVGESGP